MTTFGELRSLLQGEPTAAGWAVACDALDGFPRDALDDQIIPYVNGAAKRWPDTLRVAPESWVHRTLEGELLAFWSVVRTIDLSYNYLNAAQVLRLLESKRLDEVTILNLDSNRIGPEGCKVLANAPGLSRLRELRLSFNAIRDRGLEAVCEARAFTDLEVLDLERNDLSKCSSLSRAGFLGGLVSLSLANNQLATGHIDSILSAAPSPSWRMLDLSRTNVDDAVVDAMCARDDLMLESLDLSRTKVGTPGVSMLTQWPGAATLKTLRLDGLEIGVEAARALGRSDHLGALETLSVSKTNLRFDLLRRLLRSGALPRLRRLNAHGLGVGASQWNLLLLELGKGAIVTL